VTVPVEWSAADLGVAADHPRRGSTATRGTLLRCV